MLRRRLHQLPGTRTWNGEKLGMMKEMMSFEVGNGGHICPSGKQRKFFLFSTALKHMRTSLCPKCAVEDGLRLQAQSTGCGIN